MTKDDLKTGMLVKTRDNIWCIVQRNINHKQDSSTDLLIDLKSSGCLDLNKTNDNLLDSEDPQYDIMVVARVKYIGDIFGYFGGNKDITHIKHFEIIWQRENEKLTQVNNLINTLQQQLKDAQDEAERIRRCE